MNQINVDQLERVFGEIEELAARIAFLKNSFAKQRSAIKPEDYWELLDVRRVSAEINWCARQLEKMTNHSSTE